MRCRLSSVLAGGFAASPGPGLAFLLCLFSSFLVLGSGAAKSDLADQFSREDRSKADCVARYEEAKFQALDPAYRFDIVDSKLVRYGRDDRGGCGYSFLSEGYLVPPIDVVVIGRLYTAREGSLVRQVRYLVDDGIIYRVQKTGPDEEKFELARTRSDVAQGQRGELDSSSAIPPVSTASSPEAMALAEHLRRVGVVMYSTWWCPHCLVQRQLFGNEAAARLTIVECAPDGRFSPVAPCHGRTILGFPSWEINGEIHAEMMPLERLSRLSGFRP